MPITYLLEKDDIKADPILLNLKMFQSIYPYLFTLLLTDNFREWYLSHSDPSHIAEFTQIFGQCQHTVVRCYTTKMVTTFLLFPQTIPPPLVRTKSFDIPSEISARVSESRNISQIKVTNYSMGGGIYFPDHTFLTIETDPSRLILIQSFYECYNVNSKYGIQILEGEEMIREFLALMDDLDASSRMEMDLEVFTARMDLATRLSKFTGIDLSRHPTFLQNQSLSSYFHKNEIILPYEAYSKNICTKISSILKFMTDTVDFKRTTDLFMATGRSDQIANLKYTLYDAFVDPNVFDVENSNNIERFIFYTGYSTMFRIEKRERQEGEFTFNTYDVYYYDWIDMPVLMTGVLYLIHGFGCSELLQHAYGPALIRYVNRVGIDHKVLYKHVIAISKMIYESIQLDRMVTPLYLTHMLQEVEKTYKSIISYENAEIRLQPFFTNGLVLVPDASDKHDDTFDMTSDARDILGYKMALIPIYADDDDEKDHQKIKKSLISFLTGDRADTFFEDKVTITLKNQPIIDSIHEAFVHLCVINKMRVESSNLSFMYSYVDCSSDLGRCISIQEMAETGGMGEIGECKSNGIYEKIDGTPLSALTNLAPLRDILLQVFGTLAVLHRECKYIHHLLHTNYIMVETHPTETTYYYPVNGVTHEIKTNVRAVITNHQFATFMDENGYEWQSTISADFRPATDIFPILKNLYHQTRQLGDVDNERMVVQVMTHFFGDIETYLSSSSSLLLWDWDEARSSGEDSFTVFGYDEVFEYILEKFR